MTHVVPIRPLVPHLPVRLLPAMTLALVPVFVALGALVGFLAGLLGIGGGFTIVPVLETAKWMERRRWFGRLD